MRQKIYSRYYLDILLKANLLERSVLAGGCIGFLKDSFKRLIQNKQIYWKGQFWLAGALVF